MGKFWLPPFKICLYATADLGWAVDEENLVIGFEPPHFRNACAIAVPILWYMQ